MNALPAQLLGVFAVAIMAAAVIYALGHGMRRAGLRQFPPWTMPFVIAAAMIGFTIWSDYAWYSRLRAQLPDSVEIIETGAGGRALKPWSFVIPATSRFSAIDRSTIRREGDEARAQVLFVDRGLPTRAMTIAYDCRHARQRPVAPDGGGPGWTAVAADDAAFRLVCGAGG